jgi:hypothetical protein
MDLKLDVIIVAAIVGVAFGWLVRYALAKARRKKSDGCAGGCGCGPKINRKNP